MGGGGMAQEREQNLLEWLLGQRKSLIRACYALGLAATSTWEVSLGRESEPVLTVCILCKLYVLSTHVYALCPQGCKDNLTKMDGIMQVVFLSLQMPSVPLLLFVGFLSRRGVKNWFCYSSCEPCQLWAVAIGKATIRRQVSWPFWHPFHNFISST